MSTYVVRRTSYGMIRFPAEMRKLDPRRTKKVATPMARPFATVFVTASAGQSPRSWRKTGFSRQIPRARS